MMSEPVVEEKPKHDTEDKENNLQIQLIKNAGSIESAFRFL